jgi:hypothetical protein
MTAEHVDGDSGADIRVGERVVNAPRRGKPSAGWIVLEVLSGPPGYVIGKGKRELEVRASAIRRDTRPMHRFQQEDLGDFCTLWIQDGAVQRMCGLRRSQHGQ